MNEQTTSSYVLTFGHYTGHEFEESPFRNPPGQKLIKEKYKAQFVEITRPREGVTKVLVTCNVCGEKFPFEARSIRHIFVHYLKIFGVALLVAAPCSIATFFIGGYYVIIFLIVIAILLLVFELPEIFGRSDHHSVIVCTGPISGHKLLQVNKKERPKE